MKTNAGIRPRAGQAWVCRDGRTFEPDFLAPTDLQGFTATQVAYGATDGSLTGSSGLTWNGTTFGVGGGVSATSLTDSGLTSGRVTFASTAGLLADSANLTYGSGKLTIADGTASTSTSTGAVVISNSGGLGVSGAAWIGGLLNVAGATTLAALAATTITATASTLPFSTIASDSTTNSFVEAARFSHSCSGTAANGIGVYSSFGADTTTTPQATIAYFIATWTNATHASRTGRLDLQVQDSVNNRVVLRMEANGSAPLIGFLGATASVRTAITGSRGSNAALANLLTELATKGLITDSTTA